MVITIIVTVIAVTAGVTANAWFIYINSIANPRSLNGTAIPSVWTDSFNTGSVSGDQ